MPEESSRDEQIGEIAGFLSGHIKTLLELLLEEEGRGIDPHDQMYVMMTSLFNAPTGNRFQTPPCVSKPKILPEPDLVVARAHLQELRWFRNWGLSRKGNADAADPSFRHANYVKSSLPARIDAARNLLDDIHSSKIKFKDEQALEIKNEVTGGSAGHITQVGIVGRDLHVHQERRDDSIDPENLIIARVEILPGSWGADLVVESDPPYAITPSGSIYVIDLQAQSEETVVLKRARPVVTSRQSPRRACQTKHIAGVVEPRRFTTDLDSEKPQLNPEGATFPFKISRTDVEEFWIQPICRNHQVAWKLEIDWLCMGIEGTAVIGGPGGLFEVYPENTTEPPFTNCDYSGHEKGCPALKLKESDPSAPRSTFSNVRDTSMECWLQGSRFMGMM